MNELKFEELQEINGGSWKNAADVAVGVVSVGLAPFAFTTLGPGAAAQMFGRGTDLIKHGCRKHR